MAEVEEPTVAYQLFHSMWNCTIPEMFLFDTKYLAEVGMVSSGDRAVDRQQMLNRREIRLTAAAMALYHDEGAPITLVKPRDAMPLYRLIIEHLENWKYIINTQVNVGKPPIEDLKKFDNLAAALFPLANQFAEFKPHQRGIFEHLANIGFKSPISLSAPAKKTEHKPVMSEAPTADNPATISNDIHRPVADAIARQMFRRGS
jgi:hypothetical protein